MAPVPSMSHLSLLWGDFRLFHLNFYCIDIMLTLWYLQKSTFCPITLFQLVRFEKFLWKQWIFIQMIILSTNNYLLSLELNVLSYNSVWSWQNWKIPSETGVVFSRQSFWVPTTQCYLQHWTFHPCLCSSQYYLVCVYMGHIFFFSSAILIALNDNLELPVFM